jgi:uroporphyrinogen-III decarboxylase
MITTMTSRERLLAAINLEEPDHVPLWCMWTHERDPFNRKDERTRIEATLPLGFDETIRLDAPWRISPEVKVSSWSVPAPGAEYMLLHKRYETPAGVAEQVLRSSEYISEAESIGVMGNLNMSHGVKRLVVGRQDLPPLRHLLCGPDDDQLARFRETARAYRRFAGEKQVLLESYYVSLGDAASWLLGPENLIYACHDDPGLVEELLEIIWGWLVGRIEILLEEGVEIILHQAWYEIPDFWGVASYRRFLKPWLKREAEMVHQAGAVFSYIMTKGIMPLLDDFLEIGMDVLWGADPVQGEADLPLVAEKLRGRMCVWGGMNGAVTLGKGTPDDARVAVEEAIRVLAPGGGFVLFPVDQIEPGTPWENIEAMVERWRELASYPISV